MKALVGAFNQEKALVGDFSVIVKTGCGTDGALHSTRGVVQCGAVHGSGATGGDTEDGLGWGRPGLATSASGSLAQPSSRAAPSSTTQPLLLLLLACYHRITSTC